MWLQPALWLACAAVGGGARYRTDQSTSPYPFVVTLENAPEKHTTEQWQMMRLCMGSLLSHTWVLTSAHCAVLQDVDRIRYGDFDKHPNKTKKFSKIVKVVPHPSYREQGIYAHGVLGNDIGLVLVEEVHTRDYIKLSAVDYQSFMGQRAELIGFSSRLDLRTSDTCSFRVQRVVISKCTEVGISRIGCGPFFCVKQRCGKELSASSVEWGGPVLHDGRLAGVRSVAFRDKEGACTPVSPYFLWIKDVIREERETHTIH